MLKPSHAITALVALLVFSSAEIAEGAGVPPLLNVQGRLSDMSDIPIADGQHTLVYAVYLDSLMTGIGLPLWAETLSVQVSGGLFSTVLGRTKSLPATLFDGGPERFLGVSVDGAAEMPRVRFNSVGYALRTRNADVADLALNITCANCVGAGEIAADAVGSAQIATNAVGADEIAANAVGGSEISTGAVGANEINTGAVRSDEVQDGTLRAIDLMDEPGLVGASQGGAGVLSPGDNSIVLQTRVINSPGPGYLLAFASGLVELIDEGWAMFSLSSSPLVPPLDALDAFWILETGTITVHEVFPTDGGPDTVRVFAQSFGNDCLISMFRLTVVYLPTAYGTVTTNALAPGESELKLEKHDRSDRQPRNVGTPDSTLIMQLEARIKALEEQAETKSGGVK